MSFTGLISKRHSQTWAIAALCLGLITQGALAERKPIAFGLLGGVSGASLWGKDIPNFDTKVWLTTGLSLAAHLPAFLGIETDLLYVGKSASYKRELATGTQVSMVTAHCLEIPLLIKLTAPTESEVQPVFFGGWSFAKWVMKDFSTEVIEMGQGFVEPVILPPEINKNDLPDWEQSLIIGGGVEWGLGLFQLRMSLGQESIDNSGEIDIKTLVTTLMAGFVF